MAIVMAMTLEMLAKILSRLPKPQSAPVLGESEPFALPGQRFPLLHHDSPKCTFVVGINRARIVDR